MTVAPGSNPIVAVGKVRFGNAQPLALIAGPCALESRDHAFEMASALKEITARIGIGFVYKTSFDKANRTSARSNRGIGLEAALPIFADIRQKIASPSSPMCTTCSNARAWPKSWTCCKSPPSSAGRPI